ncbi:MAG: hypothetical protein ACOYMA_21225 [Bacteroidia bacterium]
MQTVVLQSNSKVNLKLLTDFAKKIGVTVKYLTEDEKEEIGLLNAINKGKTGKYVDTDVYLKTLQK